MVKLTNLIKKYGEDYALNDVSLELPDKGLIGIIGDSGCGKTTLLNIIGGLTRDYEGEVVVNHEKLKLLTNQELERYRFTNIGFVHQFFDLFNLDTVFNNVLLPLDMAHSFSDQIKRKKVKNILELLGISHLSNQIVANLSGGEKQRTAIARAIISSPKIIMCDEPTGALDSKSSKLIVELLKKLSKECLIIVVSHDENLIKKYADRIIKLEDGRIVDDKTLSNDCQSDNLLVYKCHYKFKKITIPISFIARHFISTVKEKKWRTILCNMIVSLALVGIGLAITISTSVSKQIVSSYSKIIDSQKIVMSVKGHKDNNLAGRYSGSFYEALDIKNTYPSLIEDIGVTYMVNFEQHFQDRNEMIVTSTKYRYKLSNYNVRHINEYRWLTDESAIVYPHFPSDMSNDQIIISLSNLDMIDLCLELQIKRDYVTLGQYILENEFFVALDVANYSWQYEDQQLFRVIGIIEEEDSFIYHRNTMWNEWVFETQMRFPTSDAIDIQSYYPWVMKKLYYFKVKNNEEFVNFAMREIRFSPYVLEPATREHYIYLLDDTKSKDLKRIMFYSYDKDSIDLFEVELIKKTERKLKDYIIGTDGGYAVFADSLLVGFARETFFSSNEESLNSVIDSYSTYAEIDPSSLSLPSDVVSGHYSKTIQGGVSFQNVKNNRVTGKNPTTLDEIVISSAMERKLFTHESSIGKTLFVSHITSEFLSSEGRLTRDFGSMFMKIVGVVDSNDDVIYHDENWTVSFFRDQFEISVFSLLPSSIIFSIDNAAESETIINRLSKTFPKYSFVNPMLSVTQSVDEVCSYIRIALLCFALITIITSIFLLSSVSYINVTDARNDIRILKIIGASDTEVRKMFIIQSVFLGLVSAIVAAVELIFLTLLISISLSKTSMSPLTYYLDPLAVLAIMAVAISMSFLTGFYSTRRINKRLK